MEKTIHRVSPPPRFLPYTIATAYLWRKHKLHLVLDGVSPHNVAFWVEYLRGWWWEVNDDDHRVSNIPLSTYVDIDCWIAVLTQGCNLNAP